MRNSQPTTQQINRSQSYNVAGGQRGTGLGLVGSNNSSSAALKLNKQSSSKSGANQNQQERSSDPQLDALLATNPVVNSRSKGQQSGDDDAPLNDDREGYQKSGQDDEEFEDNNPENNDENNCLITDINKEDGIEDQNNEES